MSTLNVSTIIPDSGTNTDLALSGKGTGRPDLQAGFKVGGTAGVPTASIRDANVTAAKLAAGVQNDVFWDTYGTVNQTGLAANAITTATYNTVADKSSHAGFNTSTGIFTVPSGYGGMYFITGIASINGSSGAHLRSNYAYIYIGATGISRPGQFLTANYFEGTQTSAAQVSCCTQVDAGETIQIKVQAYANDYEILHSRATSQFSGFRIIAN